MLKDHLARWIKRNGLTQTAAAVRIGISRPLLNHVLSGRVATVSRPSAKLIHLATGIPLRVMGYVEVAPQPEPAPAEPAP